ncbi:HAD family phosphatase [Stecheria sp. CLA-KB-P133]|uniref:HAD family phosphatase n=1 Tax=Grylomicrobium aquisgranensis TaxID=2926318 RepID=A0AB35U595_9FIRM|nr:HAD family phosphatase [Stecheria sp. CLA-KB-P133]
MKSVKAVIFDVDGLLLNTEFLWLQTWKDVGTKYGVPAFGRIFHRTVGLTGQAVNDILDEELGDCAERIKLLDEARQTGMKNLDEKIAVMPGALNLLDYLKEHNILAAVATTTDRKRTDERLKKLGLYDRFSVILCGDEVIKKKPDPEIYQKVLNRLGLKTDDALVLEDTGYGVQAAHSAGIRVIMVPSVNSATEDEKEIAYAVVQSLDDVVRLFREGNL